MIFTAHRINTIKKLKKIPFYCGVEVDVREKNNNLILAHDPFKSGERLDNFLNHYDHKFIILNIKAEGLEKKVFRLLEKKKIDNFFFLDSSFPFIHKLSKTLTKNFAIRSSDYEHPKTLMQFKNHVNWIWLDCFENFTISIYTIKKLVTLNYKICIVSPSLHNRKISNKDKSFFKKLKKNNIKIDMVCEKLQRKKEWKNYI